MSHSAAVQLNPRAAPFVPKPTQPLKTLGVPSSPKDKISIEDAKKLFATSTTREFFGHKKKVHSVAWNSNGRKLASGSVDQTAHVWNFELSGTAPKDMELKGHTDSVDQLCWDPTMPERLATASSDKTVRLWDTRSGKCTQTLTTSGENINIAWSPDGAHIAVGNKDDQLSIIDTKKNKIIKTTKFPFEVNEISWNNDGSLFFLTTGLGTVEVLRYPDLKVAMKLQAHTANIYCIKFDPTSKYFAVGSADALVSLWDLQDMVPVRTFGNLEWPVRTLSFSCDGQFIASASEDLAIDISSVETGEKVHSVVCDAPMNAVAWHPSELLLAYAGDEKDRHAHYNGSVGVFGFKDQK